MYLKHNRLSNASIRIVESLVKAGCNVNPEFHPPLMYACRMADMEIIELLLKYVD